MDDKDRKIEALSLALQAYGQKLAQAHAEAVDLRVELTLERAKAAQEKAAEKPAKRTKGKETPPEPAKAD